MAATEISIAIVVDNQAVSGFVGEHGLSLWIEADGIRVLFDTGQGVALAPNSRALGIDLGRTDIVVLSHGHYDHTGGIPHVLQKARGARIYCHPGAVHPRYSIRDGAPRPIHMPRPSVTVVNQLPDEQLYWVQAPTQLSENVGITGPVPRNTGYEDTGGPFYLDSAGRRADPIDDDMALWIRTQSGLVVCVGCSHAGIVNTLQYLRGLHDGLRIRAVIGGFHLIDADRRRVDQTLETLQALAVDRVIPCHCTGDSAVASLQVALGEKTTPGAAGMVFQF